MFVHPSRRQIEGYSQRRLPAYESTAVSEHLSGCEACYRRFVACLGSKIKFPVEIDPCQWGSFREEHLEDDEIEGYVENRLQDHELRRASLHLRLCPQCKHQVETFAEIRDSINRSLTRRYAPVKHSPARRKYDLPFIPWGLPPAARVAALVLVTVVPAIILWLAFRAEAPRRQAAGQPAEESVTSPEPVARASSPAQSQGAGKRVKPGSGRIRKSLDSATALSPGRATSGSRTEMEAALIAEDIVVPPGIEAFDRLPPLSRGPGKQGESFTALRPFCTVIAEDRPAFRWTALGGASTYTISVYDADLRLVMTSGPLTVTQWIPPTPLRRGATYTWTVMAVKNGEEVYAPPPPTRAEFKVIKGAEIVKLNRRIRLTTSHAARGVLFARAGLLDQAENEFQAHLALHPGHVRAKRLLETVRSWRGLDHRLPPSPTTTKPAQ